MPYACYSDYVDIYIMHALWMGQLNRKWLKKRSTTNDRVKEKERTSWYISFVCQTFLNDSSNRWKYEFSGYLYGGLWRRVFVSHRQHLCVQQQKYGGKEMRKTRWKITIMMMIQRNTATEKSHRHKNYICILWVDILNRLLSFIKMCASVLFLLHLTFFLFLFYGGAHVKWLCMIRRNKKKFTKYRKKYDQVNNLMFLW